MTANPIGLIIVGVGLLVAAIVWIALKTTWFGDLWKAVWGGIKSYFEFVIGAYQTGIRWIVSGGEWLLTQIKNIPAGIGAAFSGIGQLITWPFRTAFNFVSTAWNNTIGKLSWTIPGWVPVVGGKSISAPRLPQFHGGGTVPGRPGDQVLALLEGGEEVRSRSAAGQGPTVFEFRGDGGRFANIMIDMLADAINSRGGVDVVFGRSGG
jgi:hypothetical protein